MNRQHVLFLIGLILLSSSCALKSQTLEIDQLGIYMLDKTAAKKHITQDQKEGFFQKINRLEMSLQMKKSMSEKLSRKEQLSQYMNYLKDDVMPFNDSDKDFVSQVFRSLYRDTRMGELPMPDSVLLIKIKGRHYGNSVYYTRENCIVIPEDVLLAKEQESFSDVMLHELAHIYSRYNPEKKIALYNLIGFRKVDKLLIPDPLSDRMIYNPDGLELNWISTLKTPKGSKTVCPLLLCKLNPSIGSGLFANFQFALFEVEFDNSGTASILCDEQGSPTLSMNDIIPGYYNTIGTNTNYIIHPDEVIADNFMLVLKQAKLNLRGQTFSGQNLELYKNIESILLD